MLAPIFIGYTKIQRHKWVRLSTNLQISSRSRSRRTEARGCLGNRTLQRPREVAKCVPAACGVWYIKQLRESPAQENFQPANHGLLATRPLTFSLPLGWSSSVLLSYFHISVSFHSFNNIIEINEDYTESLQEKNSRTCSE